MATNPIDELLKLRSTMFNELFFISSGNLLVWQRWNRDHAKLFNQPLVKPIKVFVTSRHRFVGEARQQLISDKFLNPFELRFHLWRGDCNSVATVKWLPEIHSLVVDVDVNLFIFRNRWSHCAHNVRIGRLREHLRGFSRQRNVA